MALFTQNEELATQNRHVGFQSVTGAGRKALMAALGHKSTGERNKWGKINPLNIIPGFSTLSNVAAGGLAKGTDANTVIKESRNEAMAADLAKGAFAVNVGKAASGAGLIGNDGESGLGLIDKIKERKEMKRSEANMESGIKNSTMADDMSNKMDPSNFESPEAYKSYWENEGYTFDEAGNMIDPEGNPVDTSSNGTDGTDQKQVMGLGKAAKSMMTGDVLSSGMNALTSGIAYSDTLGDEYEELQKRNVKSSFSYL